MSEYGVVSVGAAGTFAVRKPGPGFRGELERRLPFAATVATCEGSELIRLVSEDPFAGEESRPELVQFVSVLSKAGRRTVEIPCVIPPSGEWFVRVMGRRKRFVFGVYRRHMKTIGHLGGIDELFGAPATTRSWSTIVAVARILEERRE
jgi:hypothetical protein